MRLKDNYVGEIELRVRLALNITIECNSSSKNDTSHDRRGVKIRMRLIEEGVVGVIWAA